LFRNIFINFVSLWLKISDLVDKKVLDVHTFGPVHEILYESELVMEIDIDAGECDLYTFDQIRAKTDDLTPNIAAWNEHYTRIVDFYEQLKK
jgi:hypothetical protein